MNVTVHGEAFPDDFDEREFDSRRNVVNHTGVGSTALVSNAAVTAPEHSLLHDGDDFQSAHPFSGFAAFME